MGWSGFVHGGGEGEGGLMYKKVGERVGSGPSLISLMVSVDVKHHVYLPWLEGIGGGVGGGGGLYWMYRWGGGGGYDVQKKVGEREG